MLEANDGLEALEVIEKFDPQLILTDLMMPVMDGVELIRHLKSDPKTAKLPIIAITADSSGISEKRAREAGADAFITKPVELPALLDQLRTVEARPISLPSIGSETPFSLPNSPSL